MPETEPEFSDRGFAHFEPTMTDYGAEVRVYESSAAKGPCLWMKVEQKDVEYSNIPPSETTAHMTLDQAKEIYAKLGAAIEFVEERWRE